jgi:hypothetical protein
VRTYAIERNEKMSRFCYIVSATQSYLPELVANLNSLDFVGNVHDVHVIGIDLDEQFTSQIEKLSYKVIHHPVTEEQWQADHGRSEVVCRKRYWYAAEFGKDYEATCVLDADLVWVKNPEQFFEIAAKTDFILGPGKEQNKVYDDPHHRFNDEWVIPQGYYNRNDMCNCPVFLDAKKYEEALRKSWEWFHTGFNPDTKIGKNMKCPDMDCMNIAFVKYAGEKNLIAMPGIQFLGTNEQMLKPYMRAVEDKGVIRTESGIQIYCYHGQFYHKRWRNCQVENRHNCAVGYLKADKHPETIEHMDNQAQGAMNCLYEYFKKMLDYKIVIDKKNYRHPELQLDEYPTN